MTPITYIGHRPFYTDGACGSGLTFQQGQTLLVEDEVARKMLRHPSVYQLASMEESDKPVEAPAKKAKSQNEDDDADQTARDAIANMTKDALSQYAKTHFSVDLDKRKSVGDLRAQVTGLYDQFGVE